MSSSSDNQSIPKQDEESGTSGGLTGSTQQPNSQSGLRKRTGVATDRKIKTPSRTASTDSQQQLPQSPTQSAPQSPLLDTDPDNTEKRSEIFGYHKSYVTAAREKNKYLFGLPLLTTENTPQNVAVYVYMATAISLIGFIVSAMFYLQGTYRWYYANYGYSTILQRTWLWFHEFLPGLSLYLLGNVVFAISKSAVFEHTYYKSSFNRYDAPADFKYDYSIHGTDPSVSAPPVLIPIQDSLSSLLPYDSLSTLQWFVTGVGESIFRHSVYYFASSTYLNVILLPGTVAYFVGLISICYMGYSLLNYKYHFCNTGVSLSLSASRGFMYVWMLCTQLAFSNIVTSFLVMYMLHGKLGIDIGSSDRAPPKYLDKIFASERKVLQRDSAYRLAAKLKEKGSSIAKYLEEKTATGMDDSPKSEVEEKDLPKNVAETEMKMLEKLIKNHQISVWDIFEDNSHSIKNIACYSAMLGAMAGCGFGVFMGMPKTLVSPLGVYICMMANFHLWEYLSTAMFHTTVGLGSFVLDHSNEYATALAASIAEYLIEAILFPSSKGVGSLRILKIIGFFVAIGAQCIRTLAMITAGSNFEHIIAVEKDPDHVLVKNGIYRYLRHPSYTAFFYFSLGLQLLLINPICFVGYAIALHKFFSTRIEYEEKTLLDFFGKEYEDYKKSTVVCIPFIK